MFSFYGFIYLFWNLWSIWSFGVEAGKWSRFFFSQIYNQFSPQHLLNNESFLTSVKGYAYHASIVCVCVCIYIYIKYLYKYKIYIFHICNISWYILDLFVFLWCVHLCVSQYLFTPFLPNFSGHLYIFIFPDELQNIFLEDYLISDNIQTNSKGFIGCIQDFVM